MILRDSAGLSFEPIVDLDFKPLPALGLVSLDVDVVHQRAEVRERVQVAEQLGYVVGNLRFVSVLDLELLLVELAEAVDALADVVVVEESARRVVLRELKKKDRVTLVLLSRLHSLLLLQSSDAECLRLPGLVPSFQRSF